MDPPLPTLQNKELTILLGHMLCMLLTRVVSELRCNSTAGSKKTTKKKPQHQKFRPPAVQAVDQQQNHIYLPVFSRPSQKEPAKPSEKNQLSTPCPQTCYHPSVCFG